MKLKYSIIILTLIFSSCDYFTDQKVLVIDRSTLKPIEPADLQIGTYKFQTDSSGFYHMRRVTGDLTERTIEVSKEGYRNFHLILEFEDGLIIYKQKADSIYNFGNNAFTILNDTLVVQLESE